MFQCKVVLLATAFLFLDTLVHGALDPIIIKGSHFFFQTNGSEFFIKGIAYQQDSTSAQFVDTLADTAGCNRDIPVLKELGVNLVHVYVVNGNVPASNHNGCMTAFDTAGIYVLVDLSTPSAEISGSAPTWTTDIYNSYRATIDGMAGYSNVFGFFAGNDVASNVSTSSSAAVVKGAVRDMKAYMKSKNYREIGVGYASNDDGPTLDLASAYLNCGDTSDSIDFLGLNIYSWCGDSSFTASGYAQLTEFYSNYSVPVFLSEYGCNIVKPRNFTEVKAIYGSQMTDVFSGGIAYEYFEEANDYGVVTISGNSVSRFSGFTALSTQLASASPSKTSAKSYTPSNTAQACPATGSTWSASPTLPPTPSVNLCECMYNSLQCVANREFNASSASDILSTLAGESKDSLNGIVFQPNLGKYDAYSICNITQQVSWVMNRYYLSQNSAPASCDFSGSATVTKAKQPAPSCQAFLAQAGAEGTGTITSTPSGSIATTTGANGAPTPKTSGGGDASAKASGGLSTGAKAGIAIGAVLIAIIAAVLAFFFWRRRQKKNSGPPLSGEGGLEVGEAPPQFTALRAAELEASERRSNHAIKPPDGMNTVTDHVLDNLLAIRDIEIEELSADTEWREGNGATHSELSGDLEQRQMTELASTPSHHQRKHVAAAPPTASPRSNPSPQPLTSASWSNTPWSDPGFEASPPASKPPPVPAPAPAPAPQVEGKADSPTERDELMRLEEDERRIDAAIAESERLQALRREKEEVQKRMSEAKAKARKSSAGEAS